MTEAQRAKFDEAEYFEDLREKSPHLFVVVTREAHTAPEPPEDKSAAPKAPRAPKPKEVVNKETESRTVDARKLSREDYEKRLASIGGANPAIGYSH